MRLPFAFLTVMMVWLALLAGCGQQGVSGPGKTTTLGYDLTLLKPRKDAPAAAELPLHLVVAQAGSVAPDPALLNTLRQYPDLFKRVSGLPAAPEVRDFASEVTQRDPEALLRQAEALGGDVLLLAGGRLDSTSSRTAASVLDLSVVGNYVIPSSRVSVRGQVLGALLDVRGRRLVLTADASKDRRRFTPSVSRHANEEEALRGLRAELLVALADEVASRFGRMAGRVARRQHMETDPKDPVPADDRPVATVFILSDGFHVGLALPMRDKEGGRRYIEVGLGERNWALDQNWRWLNAALAATTHNEGIAVVEMRDAGSMSRAIDRSRRVWRIDLNAKEWGEMLGTLEEELRLQEVLVDGGPSRKVVKTTKGYNLFHTCHHFALNPLGRTAKQLGGGFPKPTPLLEKTLDRVFSETETVK